MTLDTHSVYTRKTACSALVPTSIRIEKDSAVLSRKYVQNILDFSILPKFVEICRCTFSVFMGALSRKVPFKILHFPYICGVVSRRKTWKVRKCEFGRKSWWNTEYLVVRKGNWLLLRIERLFRQFVAFWLGFCRDDFVVSKASALSIFSA